VAARAAGEGGRRRPVRRGWRRTGSQLQVAPMDDRGVEGAGDVRRWGLGAGWHWHEGRRVERRVAGGGSCARARCDKFFHNCQFAAALLGWGRSVCGGFARWGTGMNFLNSLGRPIHSSVN
jgi:hypothetical protein